jgi:hypothetical protein
MKIVGKPNGPWCVPPLTLPGPAEIAAGAFRLGAAGCRRGHDSEAMPGRQTASASPRTGRACGLHRRGETALKPVVKRDAGLGNQVFAPRGELQYPDYPIAWLAATAVALGIGSGECLELLEDLGRGGPGGYVLLAGDEICLCWSRTRLPALAWAFTLPAGTR